MHHHEITARVPDWAEELLISREFTILPRCYTGGI
jgi:hypothetical protein